MNRIGQAQFIGWVLLIGFAVMLAAFVGNWMLKQAEETTEGFVDMTTKDVKCMDVSIAVKCENSNVKVINTGYFTIKKLACYGEEGYTTIDFELKPTREPKDLIELCTSIVPIIEVDGKLIGCSEKQVEVKCG